jgi:hypothetical protein
MANPNPPQVGMQQQMLQALQALTNADAQLGQQTAAMAQAQVNAV